MNKSFYTIILIFILTGCGLSDEDMVQLATEEYERKVDLLKQEQRKLCIKAAVIEAERQADSIIFEMRINPLKKPLYRPPIPPKPSFVPTDSVVINSENSVKPLLDTTKING